MNWINLQREKKLLQEQLSVQKIITVINEKADSVSTLLDRLYDII